MTTRMQFNDLEDTTESPPVDTKKYNHSSRFRMPVIEMRRLLTSKNLLDVFLLVLIVYIVFREVGIWVLESWVVLICLAVLLFNNSAFVRRTYE